MAGNADVQVGDVLTTSGVDGVYPPGLPVAKVRRASTAGSTPASRASLLTPAAQRRRRAPRARARADRRAAAAAAGGAAPDGGAASKPGAARTAGRAQ